MWLQRWVGVLAERDFRLYFVGQTTSFIGTGMLPVALSFAVLGRGGSAGQVGLVLGAETLPLVLLLLVGGVVADRANRRAVMLVSDLLRAGAQGLLAAWLLLGHPPIWGFLVLEAFVGTGMAFYTPAMTGFIPEVTRPEHLHQANALNGMARWGGSLLGPALAGVLVAVSSPGWAVAGDAASYLVSGLCLGALRVGWQGRTAKGGFAQQLVGGWRAFRQRRWLWVVVAQFSMFGLFVFPVFYVAGAVVAKQSLGGAAAWGAILAAQGAGSVVAGTVMLRVQPRRPLFVAELAILGWAMPLAALALRAPAPLVALGAAAAGAGFGIFGPLWDTTMQRELPADVLSRASAYDWFGSFALLPVGYALQGIGTRVLGITGMLWLGAAWLAVTTVAVLTVPAVTGLRSAPGRSVPPASSPPGPVAGAPAP